MLFSSITFLFIFLPIALIVYYLVPMRFKNLVLLVASLVFYAWGEPLYVLLLIASVAVNYVIGRQIDARSESKRVARNMLIVGIIVNLGFLGVFRYAGLVAGMFSSGSSSNFVFLQIAIPIGISFYTFQALSYLIDIYRGEVKAQKNIINFAVFLTMFPKLAAGPIVRYSDIEQQLKTREMNWDQFGRGVFLFVIGLAKKVILANSISAVFDTINGQVLTGAANPGAAWLGAVSFMLQIYFDFSGYSDMAIGLGLMFGFRFRKNFNYPYTAKSITDFWTRWHISLTSWFRDYVYIPLGGNRAGVPRHMINLLIVWFLTGLWHGPSLTFLIWGIYFGILLILEKYVWGKALKKLPAIVQHLYSLVVVLIGWVFFFSDTLRDAVCYLRTLFGAISFGGSVQSALYLLSSSWLLLLIGAVCATAIPMRAMTAVGCSGRRKAIYIGIVLALFVLAISCLIAEPYNPFFYFRF